MLHHADGFSGHLRCNAANEGWLRIGRWIGRLYRRPTVDLFAEYPLDFEALYRDSSLLPLSGAEVRVASIRHLIDIKLAAGRPKDIEDAARLAELWKIKQS